MNEIRVLIVEDDVFIAMNLAQLVFDTLSAVAVTVPSVATAMRALAADFNLVFLDINVTDGETFEIADMLAMRGIQFAFVSGSLPEDIPLRLRDAPFIAKPYEDAAIIKMLRAAS